MLLKGMFDFGNKGNVTITKDVRVIGEVDDNGGPRTTIKGGQTTLRSLRSQAPAASAPNITIQHIHFDGAFWTPIQVGYANGVTISGNRITSVRPVPHAIKGHPPYNLQQAIVLGGLMSELERFDDYLPDVVTGKVTISDNEIDLTGDTPKTTLGIGIWVVRTTGINANIARNAIRNVSRNSIETIDNFRGRDGKGQIAIQDNNIETPVEGAPFPTPYTPNGIVAGYVFDKGAGVDAKRSVQHVIIHNSIRTRGQASLGIAVITDAAFVRGNHLTIGGQAALAIFVGGSRNYVGQNRIDGTGAAAVFVTPFLAAICCDNDLVSNEFDQLKSTEADVVFSKGADENLAIGSAGSVKDLGSGNQIAGLGIKQLAA